MGAANNNDQRSPQQLVAISIDHRLAVLPKKLDFSDAGIPCVGYSGLNCKRGEHGSAASRDEGSSGLGIVAVTDNQASRPAIFSLNECVKPPGDY